MRYELYVDSLFLVNFVMNLYILLLVDRSTLRAARPGRLLLAAALGGGCYLFMFLMSLPVPLKLFLGAAGTVGMLPVAFPVKGLRSLLKLTERMLVFSFCMGGALIFLLRTIPIKEGMLTGIFGVLLAGFVLFLFLGRFPWESRQAEGICPVTLIRGERKVTVQALIDSGNSLVEPISGKPVSVVDEEVFRKLWEEGGQLYRVIPYHSIGKKRGILEGYLLPKLQVELHGMQKEFRDVCIAVSTEKISTADVSEAESVNMILNPRLLKNEKRGSLKKGRNGDEYDIKGGNTGKNEV